MNFNAKSPSRKGFLCAIARFARDAVSENRIANKDKTDPQQSNSTGVNVSSTAKKAKPQENLDTATLRLCVKFLFGSGLSGLGV